MTTKTVTHQDWDEARQLRDRRALQSVRWLLDGNTERATELALESARADDDMDRIAAILDADPSTYRA